MTGRRVEVVLALRPCNGTNFFATIAAGRFASACPPTLAKLYGNAVRSKLLRTNESVNFLGRQLTQCVGALFVSG